MFLVSIANVQPGQIIAKAVTTSSGAVLCPPGFRLTEPVIERLKKAGIEALILEGGGSTGPSLEERLTELQRRFQGVDDPIMLQLKATMEKRLRFLYLERGDAEA